jgi:sugar lactone lactonase YvrE
MTDPFLLRPVSYFRFCFAICVLMLHRAEAQTASPSYWFTHLAGTTGGPGYSDGIGESARFCRPLDVTTDTNGTVYVSDRQNHTIRKVTPAGVVSTLAGKPGVYGSADGSGATARFCSPAGIAVDGAGQVFIADSGNFTLRRISSAGAVTTLAGSPGQTGHVDGTGSAARFGDLGPMIVDSAGIIYVIDRYSVYKGPSWMGIRKITPDGVVTTVNLVDASNAPLTLNVPSALAIDGAGQIYLADSLYGTANTVYRVAANGVATPFLTPENHVLLQVQIGGMAADNAGNLYFTYPSSTTSIQRISPAGTVLAQTGGLAYPQGITVDAAGNAYVGNYADNTLRKVNAQGQITLFAGSVAVAGNEDGKGAAARFKTPRGLTLSTTGEIYVSDADGTAIRKITPDGDVTTFAGKAGEEGYADGTGTNARFGFVGSLAADSSGNVYAADFGNYVMRKITASGIVSTVAGSPGNPGTVDATGQEAQFASMWGAAVDRTGNVYIASLNSIRKITPVGTVTTIAGAYHDSGSVDGPRESARFSGPLGLAVDRQDNIYVADTSNHTIRRIAADGTVSTIAGAAKQPGSADGPGASARFNSPTTVTVDASGNLFVADTANHSIRRIAPDGTVTTAGGISTVFGSEDGVGPDARFNFPESIAVDATGTLYITDANNHAIRKGVSAGPATILTQPASQSVAVGASASFSVTAGGIPAPTYQWYFNGNAFAGATDRTLSFTNVRSSDAGDYTVVVTNALGHVTSNKAALTVGNTPPPTSNPESGTGGGGAVNPWFVLALLAAGALRTGLKPRAPSAGEIARSPVFPFRSRGLS